MVVRVVVTVGGGKLNEKEREEVERGVEFWI